MDDECATLLPALGGFLSLIFSMSGGLWCRLVAIPPNETASVAGSRPLGLDRLPDKNLGLWKQQSIDYTGTVLTNSTQSITVVFQSYCVDYPDGFAPDNLWSAAIGAQIATYVLSAAMSLLLLASLCGCRMSVGQIRVIGLLFIVGCGLLQGLVFLVLKSHLCSRQSLDTLFGVLQDAGVYESRCKVGRGGVLVCLAMVGYVLTGMVCCRRARQKV